MPRIEFNQENNSIELYFDEKPSDADLNTLKENGFRWHAQRKCWYAHNDETKRSVANGIFDRIDEFSETTQQLLRQGNDELDYSVVILQAAKQCEAILIDIITNEGLVVDERGFIDTSDDKRFPHHKRMPVLTYACMSPNLLPDEIRRLLDFIRKGRNMAAHAFTMTKEQANDLLNAFNSFATWYYLHSGAYKNDPAKRMPTYARNISIKNQESVVSMEQEAIANAGKSMDKLEPVIAKIVAEEVQKGVADITGVVKAEAGEIKDKIDELSVLVVGLSEKIGDYQSLVERQLSMAVSAEEEERIIHAFSEECVSKMTDRLEQNEADKNYKRNLADLKETLGDVCWDRLEPRSRTFLISSRIMYDELIVLDDVIDYSGVCLLVTKALEYEMSKRFYAQYLKYLKKEYGKDYSKYPSTMLRKYNGNITTMQKHDFTLGSIAYVFCMKPELKPEDDDSQKVKDKSILLDFAEAVLYENTPRDVIETQIDSFANDIEEIKTKYRNKAAHTNELKKKNAKECFDIILDVQKLLKTMIEAFNRPEEK